MARIEIYRATDADYVVLLGRLGEAWSQLVTAVKQAAGTVSLGTLTHTSAQIVADAATVRRSLTQLRRGGPIAP